MTRRKKEEAPPSRWGRSRRGRSYFYLIHSTKRSRQGEKLYRLQFLRSGLRSPTTWTLSQLTDARVRWLKNKPTRAQVHRKG